jgi:tRNA pseudouridine38-40 synthase
VLWAAPVSEDFHARFKAQARAYRYLIANTPVRPALDYQRAVWHPWSLDVPAMQAAAAQLLGEHDFSAFRAVGCQAKSPVRTVQYLRLRLQTEQRLCLEIRANAFLHHMVRNIVGVLLAIGAGKQPVTWVEHLLTVRDRRLGGVTAPPQGLYLLGAHYPAEFGLPAGRYLRELDAHPD